MRDAARPVVGVHRLGPRPGRRPVAERGATQVLKELIAAAEFEQGYASPEGYAALYCLILWVRAQVHRRGGE